MTKNLNDFFDHLEAHNFQNEADQQIVKKLLEAEENWPVSIDTVTQFLEVLEKEIGGIINERSLEELLKKYNQNLKKYAWNAESIPYLLDIFKLTEETTLNNICSRLFNKKSN
ncbi:hypothetical protein [Cellulophaga sp. Asnod2-G02]|uniref:hypothetical protein n=1 Tax=Cellulophaga sp. Asnod2-G02 TaxID=3160572 RepID=UPI0038675A03